MPEKPENIPDETADEIAELRAERDQLTKLLLTQAAEAAAIRHAGVAHVELFAPLILDRLALRADKDGRLRVAVLDSDDRSRLKIGAGRIAHFDAADLALELKQHPRLAPLFTDAEKKAPGASTTTNLTEQMKQARRDADRPLSSDEQASLRRKNPWAKGSFNLTAQMGVTRKDPALARELEEAAKSAA